MKKLTAIVLLAALILTGCKKAEDPITQGTVLQRTHYPHTIVHKQNCHFNCDEESPERCTFMIREYDSSGHETGRQGEVEVPCDRKWELTQPSEWWSKNGDPRPSSTTEG